MDCVSPSHLWDGDQPVSAVWLKHSSKNILPPVGFEPPILTVRTHPPSTLDHLAVEFLVTSSSRIVSSE